MSMPPTVYDAAEAAIKIERLEQENATLRKALDAQMKYQRDLRADRDRLDSRRMRLMVHVEGNVWKTHEFVDVDLRAAIDAARKEQP